MKRIILALSAGLLGATIAQAQPVEITITGATAFRANAYNAIRNLLDPGFSQNPIAGDPSLSNRVTWTGTIGGVFGVRPVTIKAGYSGSTAGIASVANGTTVTFLSSSTPGTFTTVNQLADFTFSDVFQTSSTTVSPVLEDNPVGVIPFVWVRGTSCDPNVVNITAQNARALWILGWMPLALITGDPADTLLPDIVNIAGRNNGSGTRAATLAEIGPGPFATIFQRRTNGMAGASAAWITDPVGFASNSEIPQHLNSGVANSAQGPGGAVGYLDLNDAATVTGGGGAILQYNGVTYSKDAVRNGKYTLWSYEHLMNLSGLPADETAFQAALIAQIDSDLVVSVSAIQTSTMLVQRGGDGQTITP